MAKKIWLGILALLISAWGIASANSMQTFYQDASYVYNVDMTTLEHIQNQQYDVVVEYHSKTFDDGIYYVYRLDFSDNTYALLEKWSFDQNNRRIVTELDGEWRDAGHWEMTAALMETVGQTVARMERVRERG